MKYEIITKSGNEYIVDEETKENIISTVNNGSDMLFKGSIAGDSYFSASCVEEIIPIVVNNYDINITVINNNG